MKNEYNRKITDLSKKTNDMEFEYNKKISDLSKKTDKKIEELENKIGQLKNANIRLTDNLNKMNKDLNSIKGRGVSKTIIDFIGDAFGENDFDKKYSEKVLFITDKLDKKIKTKEKKDTKLLEELKELIKELQKKKIEADNLAHSEISLDSLFRLVNGCENAKKILLSLDLSALIKKFDEFHKLQNQKQDFGNIYDSILKIMEIKKPLFLSNFGLI